MREFPCWLTTSEIHWWKFDLYHEIFPFVVDDSGLEISEESTKRLEDRYIRENRIMNLVIQRSLRILSDEEYEATFEAIKEAAYSDSNLMIVKAFARIGVERISKGVL